mmetsp:Transcript_27898/g.70773  ORF Transcript_27898/g.70773 Transcript_27898/m.70773 type:complete len:443 (-) Transcript_27898:37-1365(-)
MPRALERADRLVIHEAEVLALLEAEQRAQLAHRLLEVAAEGAELRGRRLERGDGPAHLEHPHEVLLAHRAELHLHPGQLGRVGRVDEHLALLEVVGVEGCAQDHLARARRLPHLRTQPDARLAGARRHVEDLAQVSALHLAQVLLEYDVEDGAHHEGDVARVRGTRRVAVHLPAGRVLVQVDEDLLGRLDALVVVVAQARELRLLLRAEVLRVLRPLVHAAHLGELGGEEVALVEEEDHRGAPEGGVVADLVVQRHRLVHAVGARVLVQLLVELGDGRDEDARGHVVEAVDPLAPLVALAAHVEHGEADSVDLEVGAHDARRAHARAQRVLLRRQVGGAEDVRRALEEVARRVVELVLGRALDGLVDALVRVHVGEVLHHLGRALRVAISCDPLDRLGGRLANGRSELDTEHLHAAMHHVSVTDQVGSADGDVLRGRVWHGV